MFIINFNNSRVIIMKTCRTCIRLLVVCIMICSSKEGFGQQKRFEAVTRNELDFIPDSLKTPEQKELYLKLLKVYHTNLKFRGDSVAFLLDKDSFLSEGLAEAAYLEFVEYLETFNWCVRNSRPELRQRLLSTLATRHSAYLKYFGYEYSGDVPLLEYINYAEPDELPDVRGIKNPAVVPALKLPAFIAVDTVEIVPK